MNTTFGIGNVLATGFRIWIKNFVPFTLITALIYAPMVIWGVSTVQGELDAEQFMAIDRFEKALLVMLMFVNIPVSAALTYGVVMELQGQRASIGACIATGLGRFFPVLGVAVLSVLCITGAFFLLVIPSLMVMCMLYVSTQVAVLERPGVTGALSRSRELTRGHRFEIFGLLFVLWLLAWSSAQLVEVFALPHLGDPEHAEETIARIPLYMYLNLGRLLLLGSLSSVMASVTYYLLRAEKEGTSADELARIFD
jgi:hypothetical protein